MGELAFYIVGHPPSVNASRSWHWAKRARETTSWQDATIWSVRDAMGSSTLAGDMRPVLVEVEFVYHTKRTRDRDNLVASLKPVIDGLVKARIVRDDGPAWMPEPPRVTETYDRERTAGIYVKVTEI